MGSLCIQRSSERERGERQRQRKMGVTVVLFAACVASLRAAAVSDPSTTTAAPTTPTTLAECVGEEVLNICCGIEPTTAASTTAGSTEGSTEKPTKAPLRAPLKNLLR